MKSPVHHVTITDLYLAWRQAKISLFFERSGVGVEELASFESKLEQNLVALQRTLREGDGWFNDVEIGHIWVTPKRLRRTRGAGDPKDKINFVGCSAESEQPELQVQLRCSPSSELAIIEVLFLWKFGPFLEKHLLDEVVGYRLDHRSDAGSWKERRWLYQYWPPTYAEFRTAPIEAARSLLKDKKDAFVITADFASYYDTIHAGFLSELVSPQRELAEWDLRSSDFQNAVSSLLVAHEKYRARARRLTGFSWTTGIPIGWLTSRLVANVALAPLDNKLCGRRRTACYRRYVDDILLVGPANEEESVEAVLKLFFGNTVQLNDEAVGFDTAALGRPGCEFSFQWEKVKVHKLSGRPGLTFLNAVDSDLRRTVSERRAFPDPAAVVSELAQRIVRAESKEGSRLRVFRDADRATLEKYALNTTIRGLERISSLVDKREAAVLIKKSIAEIRPLLEDHGDWVAELEPLLQLLCVAISTDDLASAKELIQRLCDLPVQASTTLGKGHRLTFRGNSVGTPNAHNSLKKFIQKRMVEAVLKSITRAGASRLEERTTNLLGLSGSQLARRAKRLALADLRMFDREADTRAELQISSGVANFILEENSSLSVRFERIEAFRDCLRSDDPWLVDAWRLFLSTRPPSYFDVSSRIVEKSIRAEVPPDLFSQVIRSVNALRGNQYVEPEGVVHDQYTVSSDMNVAFRNGLSLLQFPDPQLILGNLTVTAAEWNASLRSPSLSADRLGRLATLLSKASFAARSGHEQMELARTLLLLPELSLPRAWLRSVAHHVQQLAPRSRFGFVVGLEYQQVAPDSVENQVFAVLPGPYSTVLPWCWWKEFPAAVEARELKARRKKLVGPRAASRTVLKTEYGALSVLICSELLETSKVSSLLKRVEVLLVPAWNQDKASYDHLMQSVGLTLGAVVAVANNGAFSDCRAWAPLSNSWERDLCRIVEPGQQSVVSTVLPLKDLRAHHSGRTPTDPPPKKRRRPRWKPLPPDW